MIKVPATITKAQLSQGKEMYGAVNDAEFTIAGKKYPARTLRFKVFSGTLVKGSQPVVFEGANCFEELPKADEQADAADFAKIPGKAPSPDRGPPKPPPGQEAASAPSNHLIEKGLRE